MDFQGYYCLDQGCLDEPGTPIGCGRPGIMDQVIGLGPAVTGTKDDEQEEYRRRWNDSGIH